MNPRATTPSSRQTWLWFAVSVAAALVMIDDGSLWIDEGQTLHFAWLPDFKSWWATLTTNTKSEAQMPLAMFFAWLGAQLLGTGEWQLRAPNLLWVGLAGLAMGTLGRQTGFRHMLPILLLHPFLWFYANEARPYAMQIAAGAWLTWLLVRWQDTRRIPPAEAWILLATAVVGYGASLLFAFPLFAFAATLVPFWALKRSPPALNAAAIVPLVIAGVIVAGLTVYYVGTLQRGAAGARIWSVGPTNLFFAIYELLGFSGLGPPRNELRELARVPGALVGHLMQSRHLIGLGGLSLLYAALLWRLWTLRANQTVRRATLFLGITLGSVLLGAAVVRFPFWGRHLAPALPSVVLLIAIAVAPSATHAGWRRFLLPGLLLVGLTASSLVLRFDPAYGKDDYRTASRLAHEALERGRVVWWSADPEECAEYYQLHVVKQRFGERLIFAVRPTPEQLAAWPRPDVVIQSKPDIFDIHGTVTRYLRANGFRDARRIPAFVIWMRPEVQLN
jgi:hypothetical protein